MASFQRQSSAISNASSSSFIDNSVLLSISTLRQLIINNIEYFQKLRSSTGEKFYTLFCVIEQEADAMRPTVEALERISHNFDFDPKVPGNGYRSLVQVVDACVDRLIKVVRSISQTRESYLFRSGFHLKELESYGAVLGQLRVILGYAQKLVAYSEPGNLFPNNDEQFPDNVMLEVQALDRECFYGRCLGFQFCESLWQPLQTVAVALASYAEGYQKYEGPFSRVASSFFHRYLTNPEARGKQILDITNKSDIRFCKAFWSITEGDVIAEMCNLMAGSVAVNKLIQIQPHNFEMERSDGEGETATITPPCAHTGPAPVQIRLLCFVEREGQGWLNEAEEMAFQQTGKNSKKAKQKIEKPPSPMSKGLLIHIHGGGFVAHTSKSHEIYLRSWAKDLGVPIVSIDYSLAPEQPFPRAFEECFFAYAWAVKNAPYLGSTGEHICLAGDSSGGNLCTAVAMRAASYGIQVPDGIVTMYTPFVVHHSASPSRLLCLLDPLLPFGVLMRCLSAYVGLKEEFMTDEKVTTMVDNANDRVLGSPKRSSMKSKEGSPFDGEKEEKKVEEEENGNSTKVATPTTKEGINGDIIVPPPSESVSSFMEEVPPTDIEKLEQVSDAIDNATIGQGDGQTDTNGEQSSPEAIAIFDPSHPPNTADHPNSLPADVDAISLDSKPEADREEEEEDSVPLSPKSREDLHLDLKEEGIVADEAVQTPTSFVNSPIRVFKDAPIMRNPYVSPLFSDEELLKGLPPVHIIGCALDPLLDDSISFAKKLRGMGKPVFLEIVNQLPHGFLNFSTVGKECKEASMVCVRHIMHVLYGFQDNDFETLVE